MSLLLCNNTYAHLGMRALGSLTTVTPIAVCAHFLTPQQQHLPPKYQLCNVGIAKERNKLQLIPAQREQNLVQCSFGVFLCHAARIFVLPPCLPWPCLPLPCLLTRLLPLLTALCTSTCSHHQPPQSASPQHSSFFSGISPNGPDADVQQLAKRQRLC